MQFPTLSSGQLVQSTTVRSQPLQHWEHTFAGLGRQSKLWTEADRRIWRLRFQNLHGNEAMRLRAFFEALPLQGLFSFSDPWTETAYPNCRIRDAHIEIACDMDGRYAVNLEIENAD